MMPRAFNCCQHFRRKFEGRAYTAPIMHEVILSHAAAKAVKEKTGSHTLVNCGDNTRWSPDTTQLVISDFCKSDNPHIQILGGPNP